MVTTKKGKKMRRNSYTILIYKVASKGRKLKPGEQPIPPRKVKTRQIGEYADWADYDSSRWYATQSRSTAGAAATALGCSKEEVEHIAFIKGVEDDSCTA